MYILLSDLLTYGTVMTCIPRLQLIQFAELDGIDRTAPSVGFAHGRRAPLRRQGSKECNEYFKICIDALQKVNKFTFSILTRPKI